MALSWKLVDTLTGEPVATDSLAADAGSQDQRRVGSTSGNGTNPAAGTRAQGSIDRLLERAVTQAAERPRPIAAFSPRAAAARRPPSAPSLPGGGAAKEPPG